MGLKTVLSYLYVNPTNKRKVRLRVRGPEHSLRGSRAARGQARRTVTGLLSRPGTSQTLFVIVTTASTLVVAIIIIILTTTVK